MISVSHEAVLACPSCGHEVTCRWPEGHDTAGQRCRSCGHVFEATWPGFHFEPETVIVERGDDAG